MDDNDIIKESIKDQTNQTEDKVNPDLINHTENEITANLNSRTDTVNQNKHFFYKILHKITLKYILFTIICLFVLINLVFDLVIIKKLTNINYKINQLQTNVNKTLPQQIDFDCQATALLPQNCR